MQNRIHLSKMRRWRSGSTQMFSNEQPSSKHAAPGGARFSNDRSHPDS
ncbi:hypothetical protein IQ268_03755 [Oculatella sp. LEGE 06141]|nr:hypothetical protein [Oculatella sp. LEGE 06141]MBE9177694.1 hypothetical protein [Oculatella sp. LEGE 06141]